MPLMYAYNVLISVLIQYCVILNFLSIKPSLSERKHKLLLFLIYLFSTIPNVFIGNIDAVIVLLSISVFFILLKKDILLLVSQKFYNLKKPLNPHRFQVFPAFHELFVL